jgi:signal transduction histidine kinase/HAMP domain-containing protein
MSAGIAAALDGKGGVGLYDNYAGIPVIGVYHWMPDLRLALVAEQTQEEAFAPTNGVTAAIVGGTLVVALVTAVIAAIVTRQITQPIVQLTESALGIAGGDMAQRVPIGSRDEIGILAYVFNHMVAELKALYDGLEEKVEQRTALLQEANYQIQRRAIQLATTVEVSQAATSILDADHLLREVAQLVHDSFAYSYVGIYLLDAGGSGEADQNPPLEKVGADQNPSLEKIGGDRNPGDGNPADRRALLQEAMCGGEETGAISIGAIEEIVAIKAKPVPVGDGCAVGQAALTGEACIVVWDEGREAGPYGPYVRAEAALPLKLGAQVIGVLDILSTEAEDFDADAVSALQNVANQVTIALENARAYAKVARAYAVEREAAKRLRELDSSKRRFLSNMSHELRTPLTNIMGFSRLMLKGIEGPLTERLREDVEIIYSNGQHLLGLINDLLDISHLEAGMMELEFRQVNLADLIRSVMATASALVRDKDIELHQEIDPDLPSVHADAARIRQVLLRLLANAAKFTEEGVITVRCWFTDDQVLVSVSDTGVGIPREDQERIFERFEQGGLENGRRPHGAGL